MDRAIARSNSSALYWRPPGYPHDIHTLFVLETDVTYRNKSRLSGLSHKTDAKSVWKAVRQVIGTKYSVTVADSISAESLNDHYANISTDQDYSHPKLRSTCSVENQELFQSGLFSKCLTNFDPRQQV